jgi:hypothetical protein
VESSSFLGGSGGVADGKANGTMTLHCDEEAPFEDCNDGLPALPGREFQGHRSADDLGTLEDQMRHWGLGMGADDELFHSDRHRLPRGSMLPRRFQR